MLSRAGPSRSSAGSQGPFFADRRRSNLGKCKKCRRFLWNRHEHTICGRTGLNWLKLWTFYFAFLAVIFGIMTIILYVAITIIMASHKESPAMSKRHLVVRGNPGVGFFPNIVNRNSPLIWYTSRPRTHKDIPADEYIEYVDRFLERYAADDGYRYVDCTRHRKNSGKLCSFKRQDLGPCGVPDYGYKSKQPCIYLKINKLRDWIPEYYRSWDLPEDMPADLQIAIRNETSLNYVWVHCQGVNPHDREHVGAFSYYPKQGFLGDFFPYDGSQEYLSPIVAVKLDNIRPGFLVNVKCTSWAKNIYKDVQSSYVEINFYLDL